ncbi:hypothetical protein ONS95_003898 [Cadophora gregata]|uniref:uncharacterized protein n=1 Tax=Cadophora gregata TaxID=51156 RepID=UPI0026DC0584|nr:uncharacterized protein ONS95_003898 [Cadophora gregata]KAK0107193.1 hypothetical protein ONS95_003898 [Cadophora gregata]
MGADRKGPPLPAPTETDSTTGGTELGSRITDKSQFTLPEDGSPVTISTRRKKGDKDGHGLSTNKSQTSLLIEYFEGGKGSQADSRRPSVRVKVRPSSKSRSKSSNDHIQITERGSNRKASYTKRIQLSPNVKSDKSLVLEGEGDDHSLHSYRSATEESNVTSRGGGPIEVEIMPRRHGSPLIPTGESSSKYVQQNTSDISSMPADSFLDGKSREPERKRSRSLSRGEALAVRAGAGLVADAAAEKLRTPSRRRSRSLSRERIVAQKAVEKVRGDKSERRRKHSSRSRSVSGEHATESVRSPRRRSSRTHHEESMVSGGDSSLLNSHLSGKSGDAYSFRSGTSKSSINNPKLLETVEDAIRRLILPELTALKREQSKHQTRDRDRDRRGSITSGSGISRDSREETSSIRRLSDRGSDASGRPKVVLNDTEVLSGNTIKGRKDRNISRVMNDSPRSFERETSEETVVRDGERIHKKRSSDGHKNIKMAAAGAGLGALTAAALHKHQSEESLEEDRKERRRRRTKSRSRSDSLAESYEEHNYETVPPPMPLMSDINASEITRSSILSAETERPHSASQERVTQVREVSRGVVSPASSTPTRTPVQLQKGLGTQHSNYSRGNLSLHDLPSQQHVQEEEYELDEHGRKVPMQYSPDREDSFVEDERSGGKGRALVAGLGGAAVGAGLGAAAMHHRNDSDVHHDPELLEDDHHDYYQNNQEVPPPLRYVPYAQERRGLSPIQSVSGYTEGDPDVQHRDSRLTHSTGSYSSLNKSPQHARSGSRSMKSLDSLGNVHGNRHDFAEVRQGGLTDSELTQDGEYWEEQHRENDRNRDLGSPSSYRISGLDYKHNSNYTDDSVDRPQLDRVATGQNVRGLGAIPDYVHTPIAVESAVASLVNESELTRDSAFSGNDGQYDRRGSYASFEDGSERHFTSRGNSPAKHDASRSLEYDESDQGTSSQRNSPSKYVEEYDIDEQGRKIAMPKYKSHKAEQAIAAGVAAAVLASRSKKHSDADQIKYEDRLEHTGAPLHMSFKERAMEGQGQIPSPRHSIDVPLSETASHEQLKLGASGLPDMHDPMPEIGYGDGESEVDTNPSIIQGPGGTQETTRDHWSGKATPQEHMDTASSHDRRSDSNLKAAEAALIGAAVGAGGAAAIAHHNREHSGDHDDEWQRTSGERKRDTLITNPYEGTSPIAAIGGDLDRDLLGQPGFQGLNNSFAPATLNYQSARVTSPKDEGYISSAPNARSPGAAATPEPRIKGVGFLDQDADGGADEMVGEDPFYTPKHARHLSGMSHGMGSPIYDSATGNGIDRIQSKDIVALMDHLTVRDAQRSARDTEILVTLVRAAAEMRNSFEDMKRLLADTEDVIITEVQSNTDKSLQKAINGPRPQPQSGPRSIRQGSQDEMFDDIPNKKRNVFRRALKGLSMKSSNDLGKIEEMLVQLLGEVEGLKVAQGLKVDSHPGESYDDLGQEGNYDDRGYEPEGNAGTSTASHASQSGHLSIPHSRGTSATRLFDNRKFSDHRISTVPEGDEEELDHHEQVVLDNQFENNEQLLTPTREISRGGSAPLGTPPQQYVAPASLSNENTPRTDKSKKHKSSSSSGWIPKVSRWSETTASTVLRGFRSSGRSSGRKGEEQYQDPPSRSGSDLGNYADNDPYGDDKLHSGFSQDQIDQQFNENEPPASLLPPEDPKYKAHRNSLNLQHPQPRVGPTHRYQTALESQADNFDSPMSPRSLDWGSQTSLNRLPAQQTNRYSNGTNNTGNMSPVSDGGYSNGSASNQPPQRPPKEPLAPERPPKIRTGKLQKPSPLSNEHLPVDYDPASSPRSATRSMPTGVPARKPTGPRSMSSASRSGELNRDETVIRRNKNRDTFGTIASNQSGESETF